MWCIVGYGTRALWDLWACWSFCFVQVQRTHGAMITSLLRRNDVAASFRRNDDVIHLESLCTINLNLSRCLSQLKTPLIPFPIFQHYQSRTTYWSASTCLIVGIKQTIEFTTTQHLKQILSEKNNNNNNKELWYNIINAKHNVKSFSSSEIK